MAFSIPEMPLTAAIWNVAADGLLTLRALSACNVAFGKRVTPGTLSIVTGEWGINAVLLFPAGTDVRDQFSQGLGLGDEVEVPEGSGRWYSVEYVNDLGQGFANEHRFAVVGKSVNVVLWPAPLPPVWGGPEGGQGVLGDLRRFRRPRATVRG